MNKNFINFHVLISHSPSCLNRDDMNMQKSAVFGGKRRVRISSQSLKRTMRKSDYYKRNLGEASLRSKHLNLLNDEFQKKLKKDDEAIIREALDRFVKSKVSDENNDANSEPSDEVAGENTESKDKKLAVAPWITEEIKIICRLIKEVRDEGLTADEMQKAEEKQKNQKGKKKKDLKVIVEEAIDKKIEAKMTNNAKALSDAIGSAVDVALSGRMATAGLMTTIDGALAVAHSITTHSVDADIDWFTAVDDLQELGSGHLDTQEFSSGVFYRYASLNLKQLQMNLGLIEDMKAQETAESRAKTLEIAAHVLHMLATEVPSAKQQSFAAHNLADLAMVSFSDMPVSLANAFEEPVKVAHGGGFLKPSVEALHKYWDDVHKGYGLDEVCSEFVLGTGSQPDYVKKANNLNELKDWIKKNGQEK